MAWGFVPSERRTERVTEETRTPALDCIDACSARAVAGGRGGGGVGGSAEVEGGHGKMEDELQRRTPFVWFEWRKGEEERMQRGSS